MGKYRSGSQFNEEEQSSHVSNRSNSRAAKVSSVQIAKARIREWEVESEIAFLRC